MEKLKSLRRLYHLGKEYSEDPFHLEAERLTQKEIDKRPFRYEIINLLLQKGGKAHTNYLEIGVRNPDHNFNKIDSKAKYGVDPGVEFKENPVDFKLTSDAFFDQLRKGEVLEPTIKFDVIFIDGLHLAEQVDRDIKNALDFISEDGFIVLHDCNPPTQYHASENFAYKKSPAGRFWTGTSWKAFYRARLNPSTSSCCIDTDWGVGIISKNNLFTHLEKDINPYLEFSVFEENRTESLNLISFNKLKEIISSH